MIEALDLRSDEALCRQLRHRIDTKTKPPGSLGKLEDIAWRIGRIQGTTQPAVERPTMVVFAGDHGITEEGVSPYPGEVTYQMVLNFLGGGAAINCFAGLNQLDLWVVDAGVRGDFEDHPKLLKHKVAPATANYLNQPAMTPEQLDQALTSGRRVVADLAEQGVNAVGFGEMGIGNTSSAALLMHLTSGIPLAQCVGAGTGLDDAGVTRKTEILTEALARRGTPATAADIMQTFGGFELAMIQGAAEEAAGRSMLIVVDGFIVTAAIAVAAKANPGLLDYCFFSHCSNERGHRSMLAGLGAQPLLDLDLRLGEGTGAALAFPLLRAAVGFLNQMASFESAGVSDRNE